MPSIDYIAPPTCAKFMKHEAFGRVIAGPVGSGKTTACVLELLRRSIEQKPALDGRSYTRFAVVRQTLKQLKDTVLKDCTAWLGGVGQWKVSEGTFHVDFDHVKSEWIFIPLEDAADQARLLSMQLTGAWLSECIEMNYDVLAPISGRIGRYPSAAQGTPTWQGIIADTNMPTELSPWHKFMEDMPSNWEKFIQPGGMTPNAENLAYLNQNATSILLPVDHPDRIAQGRKYYERLCEVNAGNPDWINRYVNAQYGNDPSGQAVFKESFQRNFHCVAETNVIPGYPLIVGQDFGRNPWSLICQVDHMGRLIVHEEVPGTNIGLEKHVLQNLRPRLFSDRYSGNKVAVVGDPSGVAKGSIAEESCFEALKRFGLPAIPAPTNDIEPRLRAVEALLGGQTNGGPSLMINSTRCPMLTRAMAGGYRFLVTKGAGGGALKVVPNKNDKEGFSHVCDDLQYVCLVVHGGLMSEIARRLRPRSTSPRPRMPAGAWT